LVLTEVDAESPAAEVGLREGDLLLAAFGQRIRSREAFEQVCAAAHGERSIPLVIGRRGRAYYVSLELAP